MTGPLTTVGGVLYGATKGIYPSQGGVLFRLAPEGTVPVLDSDGDTLPNGWETSYGLIRFGTGPGSGAGDDPDGDGRTNAQELAEGTHPRGFFRRLFAEGATGSFFRTRFDFTNPSRDGATVRARFLTDTGAIVATDLTRTAAEPTGLRSGHAAGPGQRHVLDDHRIGHRAGRRSDDDLGQQRLRQPPRDRHRRTVDDVVLRRRNDVGRVALFYLLQNPQATAVTATVRICGRWPAAIVRNYTLPADSRTTIRSTARRPSSRAPTSPRR